MKLALSVFQMDVAEINCGQVSGHSLDPRIFAPGYRPPDSDPRTFAPMTVASRHVPPDVRMSGGFVRG